MNFKNLVDLAGVVADHPEITKVGTRLKCSFTVMTEYAYHKGTENVIEKTYHRCHVWESSTISEVTLRKVTAGSKVHVTGRHRTLERKFGEKTVREEIVQAAKFTVLRQSEPLVCQTQL